MKLFLFLINYPATKKTVLPNSALQVECRFPFSIGLNLSLFHVVGIRAGMVFKRTVPSRAHSICITIEGFDVFVLPT